MATHAADCKKSGTSKRNRSPLHVLHVLAGCFDTSGHWVTSAAEPGGAAMLGLNLHGVLDTNCAAEVVMNFTNYKGE